MNNNSRQANLPGEDLHRHVVVADQRDERLPRTASVAPSGYVPASTVVSFLAFDRIANSDGERSHTGEPSALMDQFSSETERLTRPVRWFVRIAIALICAPLILLLTLSLGSGWAFPNLLPDRLNGAPWRMSFADGSSLIQAAMTSTLLSIFTAGLSTTAGFLLARRLRNRTAALVQYVLYMPFVVSPVVAGVCLYDLVIRIGLAGNAFGVLLVQCVFATSFAAIFFRESIGRRLERTESLIRTLGGGWLTVWRHAVWPQCRGLIVVCLIQTALYSWLDYGLVSVIGGGKVVPLTVRLFGYIREASTNQAALASLLLMLPAILGLLLTFASVWLNHRRMKTSLQESARSGDSP